MKDDRVHLEYIVECLDLIDEYTAEGPERFLASTLIQDAVLRRLQTLSESTQRLSDAVRVAHPEIPWREIGGFRNVAVHGYLGIDAVRIWEIVEVDLPALRKEVERILAA